MPSETLSAIQDAKKQALYEVFHSIHTQGLLPLSRISSTVLVNPVTQVHHLNGDICVNYLNLSGASKDEAEFALHVAIDEEYCGVYGISLERQWPFQNLSSQSLRVAEASERLMQSVVFVLAPPKKSVFYTDMGAGFQQQCKVAFYEGIRQDGFSQLRGKSLLTGKTMPYSPRVMEIKTTHAFTKREMHAVLVPEHLVAIASEVFKELCIIPVANKRIELQSLPKILDNYHGELLKKPLFVNAPDYVTALAAFCKRAELTEFSLHAVRLHTSFDFMFRSIIQTAKQQRLLALTHSKIVIPCEDDHAVITVHKNYGLTKDKVLQRVQEHKLLPPDLLTKMQMGCETSRHLHKELVSLKGDFTLCNVYQNLNAQQKSLLAASHVTMIPSEHYTVLRYPSNMAKYVERVVGDFDGINKAATSIQGLFRGSRTRKFFKNYQHAQVQLKQAQETERLAFEKLQSLNH